MRNLSNCLAVVIACLPIVAAGTAFAVEADEYAEYPVPANAGVTSPYVGTILAIVDDISVGNIDEALDRMSLYVVPEMDDARRESMRRLFSGVYSVAGMYDGYELAAVREITPRIHDVFVVGHYENTIVRYRVRMRRFEGHWLIVGFSVSTDLDDLEAFAPVKLLSR